MVPLKTGRTRRPTRSDLRRSVDIEQLKHTVSYSRKKNLGNYESEDIGLFVQFQTPLDASLADIMSEARSLQYVLKAEVLEHLGINYEVDPQSGEVTETGPILTTPPPKTSPPPLPKGPDAAFDEITEGGVSADPPYDPEGDLSDEQFKANRAWAKQRYLAYPNEFYDNATAKLPVSEGGKGWKKNAPDFTHKRTRIGCYK